MYDYFELSAKADIFKLGSARWALHCGGCLLIGKGDIEMSEHTYEIKRLVGSSTEGSDAAIANAIGKAGDFSGKLRWFQVVETRGHISDGKVAHWQVTVDVGYQS